MYFAFTVNGIEMCRTLHTQVRLFIAFVVTCCCVWLSLRLLCALIDVKSEARESQLAVSVMLWRKDKQMLVFTNCFHQCHLMLVWEKLLWSALHRHLFVVVGRRMSECSRGGLFRVPSNSVDYCSGSLLACYRSKSVFVVFPQSQCEPQSYRPMHHEDFKEDLRKFRMKSRTWAGERSKRDMYNRLKKLWMPTHTLFCCFCFCLFLKSASKNTLPPNDQTGYKLLLEPEASPQQPGNTFWYWAKRRWF